METADAQAPPRPARLLALLAVLTVGVLTLLITPSAEPLDSDAPPTAFSAARAFTHVETIADDPRTLGSPAHRDARAYLVGQLEDLGFRTSVQVGVGWYAPPTGATQRGARVYNIVALHPGTDPTGTVILAAHYDTVRGSPGAADGGIGVATVLETARALLDGPTPRNDIMVLLTDGEEEGLLGAQMFTRTFSSALGTTVVLNHEARGNSGAPVTFRTTSPNSGLVDIIADAPGASADSLTQFAFELLPNDTDYRHFAAAGFHALDTAISRGAAVYHSPLDKPEDLDRSSLQQMGEGSLSMATALAAADLTELDKGSESVVVTLPWAVVHYPRWVELAAVLVLAAGVAALATIGLRRKSITGWQLLTGTAVALPAALAAIGTAAVPWWLARTVEPTLASAVVGEPYRPGWFRIAAIIAALGALLILFAWARRRLVPTPALTTGALVFLVVLTVPASVFPGVASAVALPALPAVAGLLVAAALPERTVVGAVAITVGAMCAVGIGATFVAASFDAGLTYGAPIAGMFVAISVALSLTVWSWNISAPTILPAIAASLTLVLVCVVTAGIVHRSSVEPHQEVLWYSLDNDTGTALWASPDAPISEWSHDLLTDDSRALPAHFPWVDGQRLVSGEAPVAPLTAPQLEILDDTSAGGARELKLRISSPRGAPMVGLWVDNSTATVHGATVDGHRAEPADDFGFRFSSAGTSDVEVTLTLSVLESRVGIRIADLSYDLGVVPGYDQPGDVSVVSPTVAVTRTLLI